MTLPRLRSKKVLIALSGGALLVIILLGLRWQADATAHRYTQKLQQFVIHNDKQVTAAFISQQQANGGKAPTELPLLASYKPLLEDLHGQQPTLATVMLGSRLSADYRKARALQAQSMTDTAEIISYRSAATQYYQHIDQLSASLKSILNIGLGIELQESVLSDLSKSATNLQLAQDSDIRQQLADARRDMQQYVDAYKTTVNALPLPDTYASERTVMVMTADNFGSLQREFADAYEQADAAKLKDVSNKLSNPKTKANYDLLTAAIRPFNDPKKLKNPIGHLADEYNSYVAGIKAR